jgi:hypothetical protein
MAEQQAAKTIRIKLVRSPIGYTENQKRTVKPRWGCPS